MQNLQPFHTFSLPVQAQKIIEITDIEQLKQQWAACQTNKLPVLLLGQGSNVPFLTRFSRCCLA